MTRSTIDVFEDHLKLRAEGDLETDLQRNYSESVVLLTENSNAQGHAAMRMSARRLAEQLPNSRFEFVSKQVNGPYALLIWRAQSDRFNVTSGADSFLIKDGRIQMQTIHYQLISSKDIAPWHHAGGATCTQHASGGSRAAR
jgi:hypothetical protein